MIVLRSLLAFVMCSMVLGSAIPPRHLNSTEIVTTGAIETSSHPTPPPVLLDEATHHLIQRAARRPAARKPAARPKPKPVAKKPVAKKPVAKPKPKPVAKKPVAKKPAPKKAAPAAKPKPKAAAPAKAKPKTTAAKPKPKAAAPAKAKPKATTAKPKTAAPAKPKTATPAKAKPKTAPAKAPAKAKPKTTTAKKPAPKKAAPKKAAPKKAATPPKTAKSTAPSACPIKPKAGAKAPVAAKKKIVPRMVDVLGSWYRKAKRAIGIRAPADNRAAFVGFHGTTARNAQKYNAAEKPIQLGEGDFNGADNELGPGIYVADDLTTATVFATTTFNNKKNKAGGKVNPLDEPFICMVSTPDGQTTSSSSFVNGITKVWIGVDKIAKLKGGRNDPEKLKQQEALVKAAGGSPSNSLRFSALNVFNPLKGANQVMIPTGAFSKFKMVCIPATGSQDKILETFGLSGLGSFSYARNIGIWNIENPDSCPTPPASKPASVKSAPSSPKVKPKV